MIYLHGDVREGPGFLGKESPLVGEERKAIERRGKDN